MKEELFSVLKEFAEKKKSLRILYRILIPEKY